MNFCIRIRIIVAVALLGISLQAQIPFTYIKGLDGIAKKEYLSPVHGLVWWHSHLIENLYRFGDQNTSTVKLIQELFYLQRDEVTFDITTLNRKPAKYFKPSTIGIIFRIVEPYLSQKQLSIEDKQQLSQQLQDVIAADINFSGLLSQAQTAVTQIQKEGEAASEIYKKFLRLTQLNKEKVVLQEQLKKKDLSRQERQALEAQVAEKNKELKTLGAKSKLEKIEEVKTITRKIHQVDLTQESLKELVTFLVNTLDESLRQAIYPAYMFHNILLGFLWKRLDARKELVSYFAQLYANEEQQVELINTDQLEKLVEEQEPNVYTKEDYSSIRDKLREVIRDNKFELAVFGIIAQQIWNNPLPPIISSSVVRYEYQGIKYIFPDCGETSIRNFLNIVLFETLTNKFNIDKLAKVEKSLLPSLRTFYQNDLYQKVEVATLGLAHDAWAQVVSALSGVTYWTPTKQNGICEIGTGMDNMMRVINHLLFGNSPEFAAKTMSEKWDEVVKVCSGKNFDLQWSYVNDVNDVQYNKQNCIIFTVNNLYRFDWFFEENHFYIKKEWEETVQSSYIDVILDVKNEENRKMDLLYVTSIKDLPLNKLTVQERYLVILSHISKEYSFPLFDYIIDQFSWKNKEQVVYASSLVFPERYRKLIISLLFNRPWTSGIVRQLYNHENWKNFIIVEVLEQKKDSLYELVTRYLNEKDVSEIDPSVIIALVFNEALAKKYEDKIISFLRLLPISAYKVLIIRRIINEKLVSSYDLAARIFSELPNHHQETMSQLVEENNLTELKNLIEKYQQEQSKLQPSVTD